MPTKSVMLHHHTSYPLCASIPVHSINSPYIPCCNLLFCRVEGIMNRSMLHLFFSNHTDRWIARLLERFGNWQDFMMMMWSCWLQELAMKRNKKDLELIVAVCWAIWHSRNLFVYECKQEDFQLLVAGAVAIAESMRRIKIPTDQAI